MHHPGGAACRSPEIGGSPAQGSDTREGDHALSHFPGKQPLVGTDLN
jgi:hypothetical protein